MKLAFNIIFSFVGDRILHSVPFFPLLNLTFNTSGMSNNNSIINLGNISEPAVILIEKISDAVGGFFRPYQIRRIARAEVDAEKIKVHAQIEITELQQRALHRFFFEEAKKQDNIESIAFKALPDLEEDAKPNRIEDDWITNFFDKSRLISDKQMQALWARVLAGEANSPGSYSKRAINFLGSLDKTDALLFSKLCGFNCTFEDVMPLIYNKIDPIYSDHGIHFEALKHLDDIGLISFNPPNEYKLLKLPKHICIHYYGTSINIEFNAENDNELATGIVLLTKVGQELAPICNSETIPGFLDYILNIWRGWGLLVSSPYPQKVSENNYLSGAENS